MTEAVKVNIPRIASSSVLFVAIVHGEPLDTRRRRQFAI
jgi:hypothetical protein